MLLSYRFSNMLSYEEETEFSLKASLKVPEYLSDNVVAFENKSKVFKTAVIVGENAGGKTNFIKSLAYFQKMMLTTKHVYSIKRVLNWKSDSENDSKQCFSIEALIDNIFYQYSVCLDCNGTLSEQLNRRLGRTGRYQLVFKASCDRLAANTGEKVMEICEVRFRDSAFPKSAMALIEKRISENAYEHGMLLPMIAGLDETAQPFYDWFVNQLQLVYSSSEGIYPNDKQLDLLEELKIISSSEFMEIFQMVDSTISKIEADEKDPFAETVIYHTDSQGRTYDCKLKQESAGVRDFFAWSIKIWQVIYENKVIFADEVDRVLNPVLASRVLAYINGCEHRGQFIFTTHNILHLNTAYFAKEQMWFVTKDEDSLNSEMYSLADFKDFSYSSNQNVYELYLKGLLGGVGNG